MNKLTPRVLALREGFTALDDGSFLKVVPALSADMQVGLLLQIHRARTPGQFQFSITADGGSTVVRSIGGGPEIERAVFIALVLHEAHELRKEAA